jgi:protein-S-isoprenylcysteine O-methyltransferase Ste14
MSKDTGREHTMKRLVVVILVVLAAMAIAPSVASARTAPRHVSPIQSRPMPARPAYWKAMWLTAQHPSPVGFFAPMPALERYQAIRLSPAKLAILKLSSKAR